MKIKSLSLAGFLVLWNTISAQIPDSLKYISVGPADFQKAYHADTNAIMIDVREFFEYRKSRLDNAVNIPSSGNIDSAADTLNKESSLYLYCTTGFRSRKAAKELYDKGFIKLYSLEGGISAWKKAGLPVNRKRIKR